MQYCLPKLKMYLPFNLAISRDLLPRDTHTIYTHHCSTNFSSKITALYLMSFK